MNMLEMDRSKRRRALYTLAMVNVAIWAIGLIALVIVLERGSSPRGMFVILAAGAAVGTQLIATVAKSE
jgi:hypothetical protein